MSEDIMKKEIKYLIVSKCITQNLTLGITGFGNLEHLQSCRFIVTVNGIGANIMH